VTATDPRTPVLVGASEVVHRAGDGFTPVSATAIILEAATAALADSGRAAELGPLVGEVLVPHGTWPDGDPGRAVATAIGAPAAASIRSELGLLQSSLLFRACAAIAEGRLEAALVVGGEARWSKVTTAKSGGEVPDPPPSADGEPDEVLAPHARVISQMEIERNLTTMAHHFAIVESAIRHHHKRSVEEHRAVLAELWGAFAATAASAPASWDQRGLQGDEITVPSSTNRLLAAPYTKWLVTQMNVDQAAAFVVTSVEVATRLGVPRDRWVFPLALAESSLVVTLPERPELHRWPPCAAAGDAVFAAAGVGRDDVGPIDLYSCFPAAVQVQAAELGLDGRPLTVTGGMTFGGGPFNNYVLQGIAAMARVLRQSPSGTIGLTSAMSGPFTKSGVALWSTADPRAPFATIDVTDEADRRTQRRPAEPDLVGAATVVGHTVASSRDGTLTAIVLAESGAGSRTVAQSTDPRIANALLDIDAVGQTVTVTAPGEFTFETD
jgi:acetyl-CoA C-acetyltransferase